MIATILRILISIWPFVREMFFAGKSAKQIAQENKGTVVLLVALGLSLALNWVSIRKFMEIAAIREQAARQERDPRTPQQQEPPRPPNGGEEQEPKDDSLSAELYKDTRRRFDRLYQEGRQ